ncbi:hypothetical protein RhiirA5_424133 [Rhizophagus irregularis]|uniref:Uncharacterized protein n=1 Tax=Rhizophagus irregularis TaxID=588596 RepID=A0A2N0P8P7_9GLOM|nr:hypothetical protein RhiirA5_424133 [Rhizophagus irregularis]
MFFFFRSEFELQKTLKSQKYFNLNFDFNMNFAIIKSQTLKNPNFSLESTWISYLSK